MHDFNVNEAQRENDNDFFMKLNSDRLTFDLLYKHILIIFEKITFDIQNNFVQQYIPQISFISLTEPIFTLREPSCLVAITI